MEHNVGKDRQKKVKVVKLIRPVHLQLTTFLMVFLSVPPSAYSVMSTRFLPSLTRIPMK